MRALLRAVTPLWLMMGCNNQPDPLTVNMSDDSGDQPTVRITVEDSQAYVTQLDSAPDRLLVQIIPGSVDDAAALARDVGASVASFDDKTRVAVLRVSSSDLPAVASQLAGRPEVERVDNDYLLPLAGQPNDPDYPFQWQLQDIHAAAAWDITQGDPNLVIAIVDTGVDVNHPDLRDRQITGFNFVNNNTDADDCCGHGTMVAGVAAAIGGNGTGVCGATWRGKILPIRVAKSDGQRVSALSSDIARGIAWAVDHNASIINVSFSGTQGSPVILNASQYAAVNNRVVTAAIGNTGMRDSSVATRWMLHVGATDANGAVTDFSSFGPAVDLSAPGLNVYTTSRGGGYEFTSGTSFSSPLAAGVVALMWSARPQATARQIVDLLLNSTVDAGDAGWDEFYGRGRLDAQAAVAGARDAVLSPDTTAPTVRLDSPSDGSSLGAKTRIEVSASDDSQVRDVILSVDGVEVARDITTPYAFLLDPQTGKPGAHKIEAVAEDLAGNKSEPARVSVTFVASTTSAVEVSMTSPGAGATLRGRSTVIARAASPAGLSEIAMLLDGRQLVSSTITGSAATVEFSWNASGSSVSPGPHALAVRVADRAGQTASTSAMISTAR